MSKSGTGDEKCHDAGERRNVAKQNPAIVEQLSAAWTRWEAGVNLSAKEYSR